MIYGGGVKSWVWEMCRTHLAGSGGGRGGGGEGVPVVVLRGRGGVRGGVGTTKSLLRDITSRDR